MPPSISLALAIHNHQPVGNFGWVIAEVYERAYEPLLGALERHPGVRLSLHYSGPLLEWLRTERPAFVGRLIELVDKGQVELLGGGLYEPVLASLPERDRVGQLRRMADEIERLAGRRPLGAWLAERVWEPDLPTSLVEAGYRWTILDDAHFRAAAIPEANLWGAHTTDDQGAVLTVFGTEQGLRYRIPFGEVDGVIDYLRANASDDGSKIGMMGDDGEKFGAWPTTWEHCWGGGRWMERFFEALEANADWLMTVTPSAWLEEHPPIGRVYVPTGSYAEMGEWALPPDEAKVFGALLHDAVEHGRPEARWLRGGFWRNFQVRYREINDLHKQMLRASAKVAAMPDGPARTRATDHLFRGQSNDCYWHGLFGGIYISHMRLATHEHLIAAEDAADIANGTVAETRLVDTDLDGRDEVLLADAGQVVTVDLDEGAGIGAWDIRAARHALGAVLRRRPERYHATLLEHEAAQRAAAKQRKAASRGAVTSIHEIIEAKESDLSAKLRFDAYERRSGLVRILASDATPAAFAAGTAVELGDFVDTPFSLDGLTERRLVVRRDGSVRTAGATAPVRVEKKLTIGGNRAAPRLILEVALENHGAVPIDVRLGLEWSTTMLGGGGNPAAWWEVAGVRSAHDAAGTAGPLDRIAQGNDDVGVSVETIVSPPADAWWSPIDTISNSESGFERVYQGSCLLLSWVVSLRPGARQTVRVNHRVTAARDRAAEEAAATTRDRGAPASAAATHRP